MMFLVPGGGAPHAFFQVDLGRVAEFGFGPADSINATVG